MERRKKEEKKKKKKKRKRFCGLFMGTYQSDPVLLITRPYDFHLLDCSTGYMIILIF